VAENPPQNNIFVTGCQRSGTSVVWACLTAHPELKPIRGFDRDTGYDPKELYYFRNLFAARRQFGSPMYGGDVDREYLREIIALTVRFCSKHHGARNGRWVSANPSDALHIPELIDAMPDCRILYVLRHPQEVVWSSAHAPWLEGNGADLSKRAARGSRHWKQFSQVAFDILEDRLDSRVLLVRHEQILENPEKIAREICSHVGVDFDPAVAAQLSGPTFNSSFANDAPPRDVIQSTRHQISQEKEFCEIVRNHVGEEMDRLNYSDLWSAAE